MTRILGVHGIWNYRYFQENGRVAEAATKAISADWSGWLGEEVRVAYYAQHLHRGTPQGLADPGTMEPDEQDMLVEWIEALRPGRQISLGPRTARARQVADWLTAKFGDAAKLFAMAFVREVHAYLSKPDSPRRERSRAAVAEAIAEHRPDVIIAHSLGSVVAYETLWAYPHHDVDLLVTIGSPLAMPSVVFNRLRPEAAGDRGARPPRVSRWANLADIGDIVAIPRTGLSPHFTGVTDSPDTTISDWDFHTAKSYLSSPALQKLLTE